ncbi:MAG: nitroreductase [Geminicoccaceae bacterium]
MDALSAILTRHTFPPVKMGPPGPDQAALQRILEAGAAAPDHGMLRPFRFLVVRDAGRERLGEVFAAFVSRAAPNASAAEIDKQRTAPMRAPVIVVVVARVDPTHPKIPEVEQIAAVAAAAQNMLLAAHALGFVAKWATGKQAYDATVKVDLGLGEPDRIIGFLYLGSAAAAHEMPARPDFADLIAEWPPA